MTDTQFPEPAPSEETNAPKSTKRDAGAARRAAEQRVHDANVVLEAVESYHRAADQIDAAAEETRKASANRVAALRQLRNAGLSVTAVSELTGLSASRIQALTKND